MQNFSKIIFAFFLIQINLTFKGPEVECNTNQKLVDQLKTKYNMTSLETTDLKCLTQTELSKNGKKTIVTKHFKVTHNGCQVSFVLENATNMDVNNCKGACLNAFNKCFEVQKKHVEEVVKEK